ncbi:MAG TPA: roadblock/LC7 domain-containing protein [Candidatus Paceibacterota bacterium]|nr:roadblock/LC7 domain-containing protein [Verrucomicrobiota bacterium]HRY50638.1 roadblock/LC7 domain-containing protein [Candidatus Paceibacterota bacterium]HSA02123.1 roadblock/LC7 domain-containing protein [Candidatus Paceibacterota bacterium]
MFTLPQLIEEDIQRLDSILHDLLVKSEASTAVIIDKGGFVVTQKGDYEHFDITTLSALGAASFTATQAIANLIGESNFSSIYQQGESFSLLINNIDAHCLMVVIFKAHISVGAVKYYAANAIYQIAEQLRKARERAPESGLDLSMLNLEDTTEIFRRKSS